MKFFNFLLASDAVGGLGPPADLVKDNDAGKPIIWFCIIALTIVSISLIIYEIVKNKSNKGDE